jgi:hypothetical protein
VTALWDLLQAVDSLATLSAFKRLPHVTAKLAAFADDDILEAIREIKGGREGERPVKQVELEALLAAGVGVNLHAASNVVLAELSWTSAEQTQAIDRVHRIGQELPVTAWRILAAQTIDTRIAELIDQKSGLAARALDGEDAEVGVETTMQVAALISVLTSELDKRSI